MYIFLLIYVEIVCKQSRSFNFRSLIYDVIYSEIYELKKIHI